MCEERGRGLLKVPQVKEKALILSCSCSMQMEEKERREGEQEREGEGEGIETGSRGRKEEEVEEGMRESTVWKKAFIQSIKSSEFSQPSTCLMYIYMLGNTGHTECIHTILSCYFL